MLDSFFGKIIKFRIRLGNLFGRLKSFFGRGNEEQDRSLEQIEILKESIAEARVLLQDPNHTSFVIVMFPEAMAVTETERLLQALYEFEIPSSHIIINYIYPDIPDCTFCRARKEMQEKYLSQIQDIYDDFTLTEVPLFKHEIRGLLTLRKLGHLLFTGEIVDNGEPT